MKDNSIGQTFIGLLGVGVLLAGIFYCANNIGSDALSIGDCVAYLGDNTTGVVTERSRDGSVEVYFSDDQIVKFSKQQFDSSLMLLEVCP